MKKTANKFSPAIEYGDRNMELAEYLVIHPSNNYLEGMEVAGFTIQIIGVRSEYRNQGVATSIMNTIENTAQMLGSDYILIQSVNSDKMRSLALTLGYTRNRTSNDYYKMLK